MSTDMNSIQKLGVPILFFSNNCCTWFIKIVDGEGIGFYYSREIISQIYMNIIQVLRWICRKKMMEKCNNENGIYRENFDIL